MKISDMLPAVEFGFKQAEQGHNLLTAQENARNLRAGVPSDVDETERAARIAEGSVINPHSPWAERNGPDAVAAHNAACGQIARSIRYGRKK